MTADDFNSEDNTDLRDPWIRGIESGMTIGATFEDGKITATWLKWAGEWREVPAGTQLDREIRDLRASNQDKKP